MNGYYNNIIIYIKIYIMFAIPLISFMNFELIEKRKAIKCKNL